MGIVGRSALLLLVAGVAARSIALAKFYGDAEANLATTKTVSTDGAKPFCFSADAEVLLGPGPDAKPGRADFDDNVNEIIDERSEMGAVGSDDVCLGPADEGYETLSASEASIVISRGGFVPCEQGQNADRLLTTDNGWVFVREMNTGGGRLDEISDPLSGR